MAQAREISLALPERVKAVGVFVNDTYDCIMQTAEKCCLQAVQLHGQESPGLVSRVADGGLIVIKALFVSSPPALSRAPEYRASGFLVEHGKGKLPGGNALSWNWEAARLPGGHGPLILAGGLAPDNIASAISTARPDAVDVSSGVESAPGQKDLDKVADFMERVSRCGGEKEVRRVF
jgi:phosphoribosylanthranilate isomerase